ncbi:hypothetical protein SmphiM12_477 [Sinorhizobium phage phiM12]|uniref:Uncharacterized protein n=2 Tax=Emdodecavirus TaxID=1980937 RepID=S5MDM3_9CAUD|nr:hypothetical protein AB690_gp144 [Sinorhizobium phage phiM12]YP_009212632.1 hypothetical protein AVT40_gp141 [Sinorhizobium phage phiN3]AGR48109.1 hypothetical protein SmphiM12_477 [Sinorhizobium phage phiM12]AKF13655.1 hypothetical protein PHIN3_392 [Sinorhizobium phage phiN3]
MTREPKQWNIDLHHTDEFAKYVHDPEMRREHKLREVMLELRQFALEHCKDLIIAFPAPRNSQIKEALHKVPYAYELVLLSDAAVMTDGLDITIVKNRHGHLSNDGLKHAIWTWRYTHLNF